MNNTYDPNELPSIIKDVKRAEAEKHAAKMGITYDELMALRRHPDKAWARAEAARLLNRKR